MILELRPTKILLHLPFTRAVIKSCKMRMIYAELSDESIVKVHSPGFNLGGLLKQDVVIFISPCKEPKECTHYIVAFLQGDHLRGANPNLANLIFETILLKNYWGETPVSFIKEPRVEDSRLDFLLGYPTPVYHEIKSCFFKKKDCLIFPVKHVGELIECTKRKPLSERSIKHAKLLQKLRGVLVFIAQRTDSTILKINPLEPMLKKLLNSKKVTKYLITTQWDLNGILTLNSVVVLKKL